MLRILLAPLPVGPAWILSRVGRHDDRTAIFCPILFPCPGQSGDKIRAANSRSVANYRAPPAIIREFYELD